MLVFLVVPIFVPVPLSFNSEPFFTFPLAGFSTRWYYEVLGTGQWRDAIGHSLLIAFGATALAITLGTLAALGLSHPRFPGRRVVAVVLLSPLIVPCRYHGGGRLPVLCAHRARRRIHRDYIGAQALASPFVVVTVGASLAGFDRTLMRAAAICGARPIAAFFQVMLPLILPGVLSGAAFAFVTSFDEVVVALFLASASQRTLPIQMFTGLREQLSPAITAAATLMMTLSVLLLIAAELIRRGAKRRMMTTSSGT